MSLGVPIWYRWGEREAKAAPNFSLPAPPVSQLEEATALLISRRQHSCLKIRALETEQLESASPDSAQPLARNQAAKLALVAFFQKREAVSMSRVQRRQGESEEGEIIDVPQIGAASVYEWDWDVEDPTKIARMPVAQNKARAILAKYTDNQKRYDPILNEWDCYGGWDLEAGEDIGNKKEKDDEDHLRCDQGSSNPATHQEPDGECASAHAGAISDGALEAKVFSLLHLHFGFVPPLPLSETFASSIPVDDSPRNRDLLIHALGLTSIPAASPLLQELYFRVCTQFIRNFTTTQPQKPNGDEWDLSPSNRLSLISCSLLKNVRLVTAKEDRNYKMYMFDFGSEATVPWKLAVLSSATVLYVCRLGEGVRERDIALALGQSGIPFRTFQEADTFLEVSRTPPLTNSALLPIRIKGHLLSLCDWHWYEEQRRLILEQPRCARAALRRGGFAWRIACNVVDMDVALAGPSGRYVNPDFNFSVLDDRGIEYVDDNLTASELDIIMGQYFSSTDEGIWKTRYIWDEPRVLALLNWWTEKREGFYQKRVEVALRDEESREPRIPRLRAYNWHREQAAKKQAETWSDEFLAMQLGLPSQRI